jgi:hypothetical protein
MMNIGVTELILVGLVCTVVIGAPLALLVAFVVLKKKPK